MEMTINDKNTRIFGRYKQLADGIDVAWVNSGIELRFRGTELYFTVKSRTTSYERRAFLQIWVDGRRTERICAPLGEHEYIGAEGLCDGEHVVKALLVIETQWQPMEFMSARTDGEFLPPAEHEGQLKFDCYGDSLTCGVGTIPGMKEFCTDHQDSTLAHAYRIVEHFGGDGQYVAIGGWGVSRGYNGDEPSAIPRVFDRVNMADGEKYDVAKRDADFIIVLLGSNDMAKPIEFDFLRDGYLNFFRKLRKTNERAWIICAGKCAGNKKPTKMLAAAVEIFRAEGGKVIQVEIPKPDYDAHPEYRGSFGHPSAEWGRDVAACFYPAIEKVLDEKMLDKRAGL